MVQQIQKLGIPTSIPDNSLTLGEAIGPRLTDCCLGRVDWAIVSDSSTVKVAVGEFFVDRQMKLYFAPRNQFTHSEIEIPDSDLELIREFVSELESEIMNLNRGKETYFNSAGGTSKVLPKVLGNGKMSLNLQEEQTLKFMVRGFSRSGAEFTRDSDIKVRAS